MTDRRMDITRRKMLAAVGAVGAAGAGAGLGTSALFNDTESFEGNQMVAGELDLLLDWQQTYTRNGTAQWVNAHPDSDTDGEQSYDVGSNLDSLESDTVVEYSDRGGNIVNVLTCADSDVLSLGNAFYGDGQDTLVELDDVKPGDSGEITFSLHLCDNPGYIWLQAANVDEDDGINTEPEPGTDRATKAPVEEGTETDDGGQLAENIEVNLWYDNDCDNRYDNTERPVDVMLAIDTSGSITGTERANLENGLVEVVTELQNAPGDVQIGSLEFGGGSVDNLISLTNSYATSNVQSLSYGGNTPLPGALDIAAQELAANGQSGNPRQAIIVFSDGGPNYPSTGNGEVSYSADGYDAPRSEDWSADSNNDGYDNGSSDATIRTDEQEETKLVAEKVRNEEIRIVTVNVGSNPTADQASGTVPHDVYLQSCIASPGSYYNPSFETLTDIADLIAASVAGPESKLFDEQQTLREVLDEAAMGNGIPLDGNTIRDGRDCFGANRSYCFGFRWELPADVGNEVQGDSVRFDLGFYTEQCRHDPTGG